MPKHKYLYHASANKSVKILKPQRKSFRDKDEGEVIFATPDLAYASCFLVPGTSEEWIKISRWSKNPKKQGPWHFICGNKEKLLKQDKGGAIYVLPYDNFKTYQNKGAGIAEWVSKKEVIPYKKIKYDSALKAMLNNKVQVIFTNMDVIRKINKSNDHGFSIAKNLESENKKTGYNYIPILG